MTSDPDFILKEHLAYLSFFISETKNTEKKLYRKKSQKANSIFADIIFNQARFYLSLSLVLVYCSLQIS